MNLQFLFLLILFKLLHFYDYFISLIFNTHLLYPFIFLNQETLYDKLKQFVINNNSKFFRF